MTHLSTGPLAAGPVEVVLGLPTHVLVVHAVVVLVPLSALGAVLVALSTTWRERLRVPVVALAAVAAVAAFLAAASGQALLDRFALAGDPLVDRHADMGGFTRWWALALLVLLVAFLVMERRSAVPAAADGGADGGADGAPAGPGGSDRSATGARVLAVLLVVCAAVVTVQTVVTGHAGSRAVWERQVDATE